MKVGKDGVTEGNERRKERNGAWLFCAIWCDLSVLELEGQKVKAGCKKPLDRTVIQIPSRRPLIRNRYWEVVWNYRRRYRPLTENATRLFVFAEVEVP